MTSTIWIRPAAAASGYTRVKLFCFDVPTRVLAQLNFQKINVLDTIGTNLLDILSNTLIDSTRTYSNNIMEMKEVLGIEAARQCLFQEISDVMEFDDTYINNHHIELLY